MADTDPAADWPVATEDLFVGHVRAHTAGQSVPPDNVDRNGWGDKVTSPKTKAAERAVDKATAPPTV